MTSGLPVIIFTALFIIMATFIYTLFYKRSINRRLNAAHDGERTSHKPLMSPLKFLIILIVSFFLAYVLFIALLIFIISTNTKLSSNGPIPEFSVSMHAPDIQDLTSLLDPTGDIPGYERRIEEKDGFRFTIYTDDIDSVDCPKMLIYAEYTGEKEKGKYAYVGAEYEISTDRMFQSGTTGLESIDDSGVWLTVSGHNVVTTLDIKYTLSESSIAPLVDTEKYAYIYGKYSIPVSFDLYITAEEQ